MAYSLKKIAEIIGSDVLGKPTGNQLIEHLLYDSRKLIFPSSSLFFAIPGEQNNGHDYIQDLYDKKLYHFVISENIPTHLYPEASFIKVDDSIKALQKLAAYHRNNQKISITGITGSNGKTILKEWLFQLCNSEYNIVKSPRSFNSRIGVPYSIWQIGEHHTLGIFEAGISKSGEMKDLAEIIVPEIGILTHIGDAHDSGFKSRKEKVSEKIQLFQSCHTIIYCLDYKLADQCIRKNYPGKNLICWSLEPNDNSCMKEINTHFDKTGCKMSFLLKGVKRNIRIPFNDKASIENCIQCILYMDQLNYDWEDINNRIAKLDHVSMRLEMKEGLNGCQLVNDSYNSDLSSIKIALDFANNQKHGEKFTLVISDILQSSEKPKKLYSDLSEILKAYPLRKIFAVGNDITLLKDHFSGQIISYFKDTSELKKHFQDLIFENEMILFKGARKFLFENVFSDLARQVHNTILEIDLNALAQNIRLYASYLKPETKIMAMVKASAYGSGSIELARFLESRKIPYLAVAYADEGVQLRKAGIQIPIMVMNPENASFRKIIEYKLEPEIYALNQLRTFQNEITGTEKKKIHIKIDSGMNRLGFKKSDLALLDKELNHQKIEIASIFSHLSASEDVAEDEFTHNQIDLFISCYNEIVENLNYKPFRHVLNSSGIVRLPEYQFEMVRLGLGMYGIDTSASVNADLLKVHTLKARISQIKKVKKGDSIGYNRKYIATKDITTATLSIGYADGLMRLAGNERFQVEIKGHKVPIIGSVCMDMCMVDVSEIPLAEVGDEAIIFGKQLDIAELAKVCKTIPYEILTRISDRVKRLYFED
jgi:alanine racemase